MAGGVEFYCETIHCPLARNLSTQREAKSGTITTRAARTHNPRCAHQTCVGALQALSLPPNAPPQTPNPAARRGL
eukprot:5636619-Prymnesium_polylepis.1